MSPSSPFAINLFHCPPLCGPPSPSLCPPPLPLDSASFGEKVAELKLLDSLLVVAHKHHLCAGVQTFVLSIVDHIFGLRKPSLGNVETAPEEWLEVVKGVFVNHKDNPKVRGAACQCLARLLEVFSDLRLTINDKEDE